jgi:hypothetical protein
MIIGFEQNSYTVMEGYTVEVCLNATVQGTVNRTVMVNISTADYSTLGEKFIITSVVIKFTHYF